MDDLAPESHGFQKGLREASERFKHIFDDPEVQRELAKLQQYIREELDSVREFGVDIPGFDDCPGNLIDLCKVVGVDPHGSDFEELISAVRVYLMRERIQEQVRTSIKQDEDETEQVGCEEWSPWFYKSEWKKAWGSSGQSISKSTFKRILKDSGEEDPGNNKRCRFPLDWLRDEGKSTPAKANRDS